MMGLSARLPLFVLTASGAFMLFEVFLPAFGVQQAKVFLVDTATVLLALISYLVVAEVVKNHGQAVLQRNVTWPYSGALVFGFVAMVGLAAIGGVQGRGFVWLFEFALAPLQSALFGLLAFFIVSAALRAMRFHSLEISVFTLGALVVILGRSPVLAAEPSSLGEFVNWLLLVPQTAAMRALWIGAGLGALTMGMRLLVGQDRALIGGDKP